MPYISPQVACVMLVGARGSKGGSRFWSLAVDHSSDEDGEAASQRSSRTRSNFIRDAL